MKVLHINRNFITSALHQVMINHLDALGVFNTVFAPTDNRHLSIITPGPNVIVSECFKKNDRYFFDYKQHKIQKSLEQLINVKEYNIIHAYTLFTDGNIAMQLHKKYESPYLVAVRNTDVNDFFRRLPYLRARGIQILRNASVVFFLSEAYKNQVINKYVPVKYQKEILEKSVIIPNGIDDFWIQNAVVKNGREHVERINNNEINLICAGRIDKNKNIISTIKAIEILQRDGWKVRFTVVGKIDDKSEYLEIIKSDFVHYITLQPKEKLIDIYRSNDIFVMPSYTESFGLVYAEAMSQGLPVVYTKNQGFDGQFPEGMVGFHVDAFDVNDIATAIKNICLNYSSISYNCPEACKKFRWGNLVNEYYIHYKNSASFEEEIDEKNTFG